MTENLYEWLTILVRWLHIITAIAWIGSSFFFNWMDRQMRPQANPGRKGHIGELWMVHGGGFYQVEKMLLGPNQVPAPLHWFKWEAAFTWLSGTALLLLVYYRGGGSILIDTDIANLSSATAMAIGLGTLAVTWVIYDLLWQSPLRHKPAIGHTLTILLATAAAWFLCTKLSGRAAYIHVGGMLGTWMVANVWMRILPGQRKMIAATQAGEPVNPEWGNNAKNRSVHNNYFTLPVIFIMMSSHFPTTYGHDLNWVILLLIGVGGAAVRHYFNVRIDGQKAAWPVLIPAFLALGALIWMTQPSQNSIQETAIESSAVSGEKPQKAAPPKGPVGTLHGTIRFEGRRRPPKKLTIPAECTSGSAKPAFSQSLMVKEGMLQNAVIYLAASEATAGHPPPSEAVVLDQVGCIYQPHVVGVQAGQPVTFLNSDPVLHNIKTVAKINRNFNIGMPQQNSRITRTFKRAEMPVKVKCSLHPWMNAYVAVVPHPFFAVSGETGTWQISGIPAGDYTLEVWHELLGNLSQDITVTEGDNSPLDLTLTRAPKK